MLGNRNTLEKAKGLCEQHYANGCDLSAAERILARSLLRAALAWRDDFAAALHPLKPTLVPGAPWTAFRLGLSTTVYENRSTST
jgi:hypothetical protein